MSNLEITKEEFCARFVARIMAKTGGGNFQDDEDGPGESIEAYAKETAPTYWEDRSQRAEGPEECADADMSYWGD